MHEQILVEHSYRNIFLLLAIAAGFHTRLCLLLLLPARQLRVVMRSLSGDAAVVLVHALVTSRIDHSCSVLVGLSLGLIGRLDRVLRSAACLIGHIRKYASVSAYMRAVLHCLPVPQRILYRISALVWRSVTGCALSYLTGLCRPVSDLASRRACTSLSSFFGSW